MRVQFKNLAAQGDFSADFCDLRNRRTRILKIPAVEHTGIIRTAKGTRILAPLAANLLAGKTFFVLSAFFLRRILFRRGGFFACRLLGGRRAVRLSGQCLRCAFRREEEALLFLFFLPHRKRLRRYFGELLFFKRHKVRPELHFETAAPLEHLFFQITAQILHHRAV